jgi:hypothetical protein
MKMNPVRPIFRLLILSLLGPACGESGGGVGSGISTDGTVTVWTADNNWMSMAFQVPTLVDVVAVGVQGSRGTALHPSVIEFSPPGLNPAFTPARGMSIGGSDLLVLRTP